LKKEKVMSNPKSSDEHDRATRQAAVSPVEFVATGDHSDVSSHRDESKTDSESITRDVDEINERYEAGRRQVRQGLSQASDREVESILNNTDAFALDTAQLPPSGASNPRERIPDLSGIIVEQARQIRQISEDVHAMRGEVEGPKIRGIRLRYVTMACSYGYKALKAIPGAVGVYYIVKTWLGHNMASFAVIETSAGGGARPVAAEGDSVVAREWLHPSGYPGLSQEAAFWENVAVYVTNNQPRPYDEQLMFMQFTEDLALIMMSQEFRWATARDKVALIYDLAALIAREGLAMMYRRLPELTYRDKPLPRAIAASLASHAIIKWWAEQ
jgi:hypothetical protein